MINDYDSATPTTGESPSHSATPEARADYRVRVRASLLIGLCCFLIYNANLRSISAGDTYSARFLPFAIMQYHTIFLDRVAKVAAQGRGEGAFWLLHRPDGHFISLYPVVAPVLVAPLYVPAVAYLHLRGWSDARLDHVASVMEKLTASLLAALSTALLYLLLRRRASESVALLLTAAYAFGTTTWVVSSQAMWQHGMAQLLIVVALLLLTGVCSWPRVLAVGLLLGLMSGNRPPDVILAAALGAYALFFWAGRRRAPLLIVASLLPMLAVLLYNLHVAANIFGGYGVIGSASFFRHDLLSGVGGLLVSPSRGLLVFSPFFLFLALAWRYRPEDRNEQRLTVALSVSVVLQLLIYAKTDWRSGLSWGPRYMTDLLPLLIWMLVPVVAALRGAGRLVFQFAVAVAVVIEAIGAFAYSWPIDLPLYAVPEKAPHAMDAAWQWRNAPFIASMRRGFASRELLTNMRGSIDAVQVGGRTTSEVVAGEQAFVTGWALAGEETPWQVAVNIDGRLGGSTRNFSDRPDVRAALREPKHSGWRIALDTAGVTAGEHQLTALIWASKEGEGHYLDMRSLTVRAGATSVSVAGSAQTAAAQASGERPGDEDLKVSLKQAAARIREHQQPPGYWLTSFTSTTSFQAPRPEMNTFLTALMVDLLNPLPPADGLGENLQRAKKHLTGQIESNGLVRYHGLPDAPGIGTLGCVITPDTDDTALVWRLAPASDRSKLTSALAILERYRTREGLYRSWLAPRDAYQCLDPGSDPNPADVVIQMHALMLLSEAKPAAGRSLCEALRTAVDDDHSWVYYRKTPLLPILRLRDVRRAGCALKLPASRMRSDVAGQEIWVAVARILGDATRGGGSEATVIRALLRELARDDFALLQKNPPLLYHNDLTATVSRYYWSEDVGYALWLRLYDQYEHSRGSDPGA